MNDKTKEFIAKAINKHGKLYDYSKVDYLTTKLKVTIVCPTHGEFQQTPGNHLKGQGCRPCGSAAAASAKRMSSTEFITRANKVHSDRYYYTSTVYLGSAHKVVIRCIHHGEFSQSPARHLNGVNCPKCSLESAKGNIDDFILKANEVHGCKYDYSKSEYAGSVTKLTITCPTHGDFTQSPNHHLSGKGCYSCGKARLSSALRSDTKDFVDKARTIHGDTYVYNEVNYVGVRVPVTIICKPHGRFQQIPDSHLAGRGCAKCGNTNSAVSRRNTTSDFVAAAKRIHGGRYDYTDTVYRTAQEKVNIKCLTHGLFAQEATGHLGGKGCRLCAIDKTRSTKDIFVKESKLHHGDTYNYDKVVYVTSKTPVTITCLKHGDYQQVPDIHKRGGGCSSCVIDNKLSNTEEFVTKALEVHQGKYTYHEARYVTSSDHILITCGTHGLFSQIASTHLCGSGCPKCAGSKGELRIIEILDSLNIEYVFQYTLPEDDNKYRYDFYIPGIKLLLEYDESHHWYDETIISNDKVKNLLASKFNYELERVLENRYTELNKYLPYVISKYGKYYINKKFYMTVHELCAGEKITNTGSIKDYEIYLVFKK